MIYEFWSVATRPVNVNGLGMSVALAKQSVEGLLQDFILLKDERGIYSIWQALVITQAVSGKTAHDARLAAAMYRHGLSYLVTFNAADFQRFPGVSVLLPVDIVAGKGP